MHPILVHLPTPWGVVPIYSYGVMLGLSLIAAWYFVMRMGAAKEGLDRELMANTFIVTAVSAIVGSRVLYILTNLDELDTAAKWFSVGGGLVAYGGFLGGFLASWLYLRTKRVPLMAWADVVAPTLGLGLFLTRIGCYLYGCDFGARLSGDAPRWLASLGSFPRWPEGTGGGDVACARELTGSPAFSHHVATYGLDPSASASFPVHPTQLYESAVGLALFAVGLLVWRSRRFRGQVLTVLAGCYGLWRFFVEMVRDDPERGSAMGLSTSQLISLLVVPLSMAAYVSLRNRARREGGQPAGAAPKPKPASSPSTVKRRKPKAKKKR